MSKKNPTNYQTQRDLAKQWLTTEVGRKFSHWWSNHRHSGYATRGTETRWGIRPWEATLHDRYMAEFYSDHNMGQKTRYEYSAEEYEKWAQEQREADDAVAAFAAAHDGREIPTTQEFSAVLGECVEKLRQRHSIR